MMRSYKRAHGISKFIFRTRRFLQLRGKFKEGWAEDVDARIIPGGVTRLEPAIALQFLYLLRTRLLHQTFQRKLLIEKYQSTFCDILAASDCDDTRKIVLVIAMNHLLVGFWFDQNIAVTQE